MSLSETLSGVRIANEYFDLKEVDVSLSKDKKSFDATAILKSTYHASFLERGLATLQREAPTPPVTAVNRGNNPNPDRAARSNAERQQQQATLTSPPPLTLANGKLVVGPAESEFHPSRMVSISLDGASVNLGKKGGVGALLKEANPAVVVVHGVAHNYELSWADALVDMELINKVVSVNQEAYVHYSNSAKKRLSFLAVSSKLGEEESELVGLHGIRWREASHRSTLNILKSWRARVADLLDCASTEIGLHYGPLTSPEVFVKMKFKRKLDGYPRPFVVTVTEYLGTEQPDRIGEEMFLCTYTSRETELLSKGEIISHLHDVENKHEELVATKPGETWSKLVDFSYVKANHLWADLCAEGKAISKLFQTSGLLWSEVMMGLEDSLAALRKMQRSPGKWATVFQQDYKPDSNTLDGHELLNVAEGEALYAKEMPLLIESIINCTEERFKGMLSDPVLKAFTIFEHAKWPSIMSSRAELESFGDDSFEFLLKHFSTLYGYLGGDADTAKRQWARMKIFISNDGNLSSLKYEELWLRSAQTCLV